MKIRKILLFLLIVFLISLFFYNDYINLPFLDKKIELAQKELAVLNNQSRAKEEINTLSMNNIQAIDKKEESLNPLLLKKYSKISFLDKNYVPDPLVEVNKKYLHQESVNFQILRDVNPFLESLLFSNREEGLSLDVLSVYRSFDYQAMLKKNYIKEVGLIEANKFSADAGFSEHQLGTAIDFTTPEIGGKLSGFEKTAEYAWLLENGYKYGFVLSYPEDNPYYKFEPWHWRFVGINLATKLKNENKYLNDLEQAEIDKYLEQIFQGN